MENTSTAVITAQELRQGNFLDYHGQTVVVLDIYRGNKIECGYFNDSIGFLRDLSADDAPKPIPLTKDWQNLLGLNQTITVGKDFYSLIEILDDGGAESNYEKEDFRWALTKNNELLRFLDYVHQLQNLYHSLTGLELVMKMLNINPESK